MLWIVLTAAAAPLQVARNALQRGLVGDAGPWGATLVRFLFGLPFALIIFAVVALATPDADPRFSWRFAAAVSAGAAGQVAATAALLVAMRRSGFAVATFMQQSSLPLAETMATPLPSCTKASAAVLVVAIKRILGMKPYLRQALRSRL